jgi:hypothetical protein
VTLALLLNNKSPDKKEEKEDRKARKKKTKTEDQKRRRRRKKNKKEARKKAQNRSQQKKLKKKAQHNNQITVSDEKFISRKETPTYTQILQQGKYNTHRYSVISSPGVKFNHRPHFTLSPQDKNKKQ